MLTSDSNNISGVIVEGGVSSAALVFLNSTIMQTIPWLICVIPLLIIDGIVGVRASILRYEKYGREEDKFKMSKLFRKTIGKCIEYVCWCVVGSSLSLAFEQKWIAWLVLGLVFVNEGVSIWGHKLELQGVEISTTNLWRLIFRKGAEKVGVEVEKEEVEEIIKPKPARDSKGRFIKKNHA